MWFQYGKASRRHTTLESLSQINKIPTEQHIINRYKFLALEVKNKSKRALILKDEVRKLCLPMQQGKSTDKQKLKMLLNSMKEIAEDLETMILLSCST